MVLILAFKTNGHLLEIQNMIFSMISYLTTVLAFMIMAFTASAQLGYQTYSDSQCSSSPVLYGAMELCECVQFQTNGFVASAIYIDGYSGVTCSFWKTEECSKSPIWGPVPAESCIALGPGQAASLESMACGVGCLQ